MKVSRFLSFALLLCLIFPALLRAQSSGNEAREAALQKLKAATNGAIDITRHKATSAARFIRMRQGASSSLGFGPAKTTLQKKSQSAAFFNTYGPAVGVKNANSVKFVSAVTDKLGETHLTYKQYQGKIPVYAGTIRTHFDSAHQLKAI